MQDPNPMHDPNAKPTPDDPHKHEPIHDPPMHPEHDPGERKGRPEVQPGTRSGGVRPPNPSPDSVVFDENKEAR